MSAEKEFFWKDLSGRGYTNTFTESGLINALEDEDGHDEDNEDEDEESIKYFAENAEVGDEWSNAANKVIRTK